MLVIAVLFMAQAHAQKSIGSGTEQNPTAGQVAASLRGNGMRFTQNKGQITDIKGNLCPNVLYKGEGGGADIYLRNTGISYVNSNISESLQEANKKTEDLIIAGILSETDKQIKKNELLKKENIKLHRVDMDFVDCNKNTLIIEEGDAEGCNNYYYAHCPQGITNVKQYNKVTIRNIYDNIDVAYYGNRESGMKYDIIIQPHGDPSLLNLRWTGFENIHLNGEGALVIKTSINEFYESIPKVYQVINGAVVDIKAEYSLKSEVRSPKSSSTTSGFGLPTSGYFITFKLSAYNPDFPLIIDPVTWITYYGGISDEQGISVTTDALGNAIFSGYSTSVNFPVSTGAYQSNYGGGIQTFGGDAFIVKMNPAGGRVFSTYFGGSSDEYGRGIFTNSSNDIYLTGSTGSTDLPVILWGGAFIQAAKSGAGNDAFIAKFSSAGTLLWSTYYGGNNWGDEGIDVSVDLADNIYFTGYTNSINFPTQVPFQPVYGGNTYDAFIVKFNNAGVRQWSTFYGGSNLDYGLGICTDAAGNIFVAGYTESVNFPTIAAHQGIKSGGTDAFLIRLDPATGFPVWSTYYGGSGNDIGTAVAADAFGNVYLALMARSPNNISTTGAFQVTIKGSMDAAVIKFTSAGVRVWGTYLGGNPNVVIPGNDGSWDYATGIAVDANNNIIVAGDTYSTTFPTTSCSYQPVFQGTEDQFISVFDQQGKLICSSYLGTGNSSSANNETYFEGGCIAVYGNFFYLASTTGCNYPVTPGAFQTACGSNPTPADIAAGRNNDAAFSKLCIFSCGLPKTMADFTGPVNICTDVPAKFNLVNTSCDTTKTTYLWSFPGAVPISSIVRNPSGIRWNSQSTYNVSVKVMSPCDTIILSKPNYITVTNCEPCLLTAQFTKGIASCSGCGCKQWIMINAAGGTSPYSYSWPDGYDKRYKNQLCPGAYTIKVTDKNNCSTNITLTAP